MSFQLTCPNCGKRSVSEFMYRGELRDRPSSTAEFSQWSDYVYLRDNRKGTQREWWYHRSGCQSWFVVERDTTTNHHQSRWFKQ
ncbi:MAG: sarcosine oxidase subunit delta [Elainellaceae cyanobacterium]